MTSLPHPDTRPPDAGPPRLVTARAVAAVAALFWGVLFFGVIDLLVVPLHDDRFAQHYLLETGWGLLFTLLVMVPLLQLAVRPRAEVLARQVLAVALAVLVCGVASLGAGQVLVGCLLAVSATVPAALAGQPLGWRPQLSRTDPWLGGLLLAAGVSAAVYAVRMVHASYDGTLDDITWGLPHLPMQAAFGLALVGTATVAALPAGTAGTDAWSRWAAVLAPAASAIWIGVVSIGYPHRLGSLGTVGGGAAVVWGAAFAALALRQATQNSLPSGSSITT